MQESLKYLLLSDVLSTMEAQHRTYGIDKHLQIQELWQKLPDDLPLEEYKTFIVPILATNKQEQKYLHDLFEESLKRVKTFAKTEAKAVEQKVDEVAWWKNVIAALVFGLLLFLAYYTYKYFNPVEEHETMRESIFVMQNKERVLQLQLLLRPDTLSDISFTNGQKVGDTALAHYYIDQDSLQFHIEAKDTFSTNSFEVCLRFIYSQPPIDTICYDITILKGEEEEKPLYTALEEQELPYAHDFGKLPPGQDKLARAKYWRKYRWWIKTMLILLVGAILWAIIKWREKRQRQLIAEIESKDQAPYVWNIELEEDKRLGLNESFMLALRRLRKRREEEIYHLDVAQTVNATIKNAGLVNFQYSQATRPPEYLLLIDRKNRNDHRAALFDVISQTFKDNDVLVERYFFDGDLRTCYNTKHPWGIGLKDLQHLYHNSRLLIISDGYRLLNPMNGKLARWTKIFNSWKHTAILSPLPLDKWGRKEQQLRQLFQVMPNTVQGLKAALEQFDSLEAKDQETVLGLIEDAPKAPITVQGNIIETLQKTFKKEPKLVDWVAACAVYPSLHWDLTLHFGKTLSTEEHNILSLDNLQELTRLPWFVEGKFPDAVREELLVYLKNTGQDDIFRKTLYEALDKAPKPDDKSVASEEYRMNVVLNEWLFTKDKAKKKELEEEFARYLAAGNDPDFVVFKYLDRESGILDTPIPDSWRQYISGEQLSIWRSQIWPWALLAWLIFSGYTIQYNPKFDLCPVDVIEYKGQILCLDEPWKEAAYLEFLALDLINKGKPEAANTLLLDNGEFLSTNKFEADTLYRNVAIGFYNHGAKLHNEFFEFEANNEENAVLPDSICRYFEYASSTDSLSVLAKDMSIYSAVKGNMIIYEGLAKCIGDEWLTTQEYIAANKNRAIYEMKRTGVPASVILAQMIRCWLENSRLFYATGNPLCIRCREDQGDNTIVLETGCFKTYGRVDAAFQDYQKIVSDIMEQDDDLFVYPGSDYRLWAEKLAEYQFSPETNYDQVLIRIIERYNLSQYDDSYDDSSIETVQIGDQTWTSRNLNIIIPDSWCFDNNPDHCEKYGRLYTQEAANLACASLGAGWRLPTMDDWMELIKVYDDGPGNDVYQALIEGGRSNFNAKMGGYRMPDGSYRNIATMGNYWSATTKGRNDAEYIYLSIETKELLRDFSKISHAKSCRCVKQGEVSSSIQQRSVQTELEIFTQAGLVGLRDQDDIIVVKPIYNNIELDSTSQLYRVQAATRGGLQMGYINRTGRVVIPIEYQSLGFLQDGLILAEKNRYGYLDAFGNVVIDFEYEQASNFEGGVAQVMKRDGNQALEYGINTNGNCVENCPDGLTTASDCYATQRAALLEALKEQRYRDAEDNLRKARNCPQLGSTAIKVLVSYLYESIEEGIDGNLAVMDEGLKVLADFRNISKEEVLAEFGYKPNVKYDSNRSSCYQSNMEKGQAAFGNKDFNNAFNFYVLAERCEDRDPDTYDFDALLLLDQEVKYMISALQALYQKESASINDPVDVQQGLPIPNYGTVTDPRDGQSYRTVTIGNQTWLAQNMNIQLQSSWCYDNDPKYCQTYGRLYNWEAAKQACDGLGDGWHLPSMGEWDILFNNYGGENSNESYRRLSERGNIGFEALLGGYRDSKGRYDYIRKDGYYWSVEEYISSSAWYFHFNSVTATVDRKVNFNKQYGLLCRCVKN